MPYQPLQHYHCLLEYPSPLDYHNRFETLCPSTPKIVANVVRGVIFCKEGAANPSDPGSHLGKPDLGTLGSWA